MAFDLAKLAKAQEFKIETESLGTLFCKNFTTSVMKDTMKWLDQNGDKSSNEFAIKLATLICHIADQGDEDNSKNITSAEAQKLTDNDLEIFAKRFIEKNSNFLNDPEKKETIREKNKDGEIVVHLKNHPSDELAKKEDETYVNHLRRATHSYTKNYYKRSKALFEKTTKSLFSNSTMELFKQNERLSKRLGDSLFTSPSFEPLHIPENPAYETNRTLSSMANELQQTAYLIKNMNDLGVQITKDTAIASERTKFWNNVMFGLGIITLLASALLSYLALVSANTSSVAQTDLLEQQNELLTALNTTQKESVVTMGEIYGSIQTRGVQLEELTSALENASNELKNITSQSSSQPTAARTP